MQLTATRARCLCRKTSAGTRIRMWTPRRRSCTRAARWCVVLRAVLATHYSGRARQPCAHGAHSAKVNLMLTPPA